MLRIFCFIFSVMILFSQLTFAELNGGDIGGGNEQGNAGKGEFCKKYNICSDNYIESNSLGMTVSYLRRLKTEDFERYLSLEHFAFNYSHHGEDYETASLLREAFTAID